MINVGIIGLGHIATHQIAALERSDKFQLLAGCDPDRSRHPLLGEDVAAYTSPEKLVEREDLDVVVVASPNRVHVAQGILVMSANKWLFMEKPLSRTQEEFDRFDRKRQELSGRCTMALHAAFGLELEWYCEHRNQDRIDVDDMSSFTAAFYDPYFENGQLMRRDTTSWGSWMDSGINALSVICRLINPDSLEIRNSLMKRDEETDCLQLEGHVEFGFAGPNSHGTGVIDTSWTTGRDKKVTVLSFQDGDRELVLDHSEQQVILREGERSQLLFSCSNDLPRLTNHYIGAFRDLALQMETGTDNFEYGKKLHRLVLEAEHWAD